MQFNVFKLTPNPFSLVSLVISLIQLLKSLSDKTCLGHHLTIIRKKKKKGKIIQLSEILGPKSNNDTKWK